MLKYCMFSCILLAIIGSVLMFFPNMMEEKEKTTNEITLHPIIKVVKPAAKNHEQKDQELFDETQNLMEFYQSINNENFVLKDKKLQLEKENKGLELLEALKTTLSRKAASPQDLESALSNWSSVAKEFALSRYYAVDRDVWNSVTKDHLKFILDKMKFLVFQIHNSDLATSTMKKLDFTFWSGMTSNQLETLLNMIEHLSIHVTDSALFVEQLCCFLEKKEKLTPEQINQILSLLEKSITPKNESKYTTKTILNFCFAIYNRLPSSLGDKNDHSLTPVQLKQMLNMLQILIESAENTDDLNLNSIKEKIQYCNDDVKELWKQFIQSLVKSVPDITL